MLKMKYLIEDFDLARQALPHWAHDEDTLTELLGWFRISSNAVYPFNREGRICFLRLSPAAEKEQGELQGELDFLRYLQEQDVPAMRPVPARDGALLLTIDGPEEKWFASVFEGVPGHPLEELPMTDSLAGAYGAALGRLHRAAMDYVPPQTRRSHREVLDWIVRTLKDCGAPISVQKQVEITDRRLAALPQNRHNYGLVHYDFEPDNVFWDGERCHAIDFEDGMLHFYAIDVVQALDELDGAFHGAFMAGYRAACPEAAVDRTDFPLMRRFRDLYSCARLFHCLLEIPDVQPEWMPQLVLRLQARRDEILQRICTGQDSV